jgi:hypothetical protein
MQRWDWLLVNKPRNTGVFRRFETCSRLKTCPPEADKSHNPNIETALTNFYILTIRPDISRLPLRACPA